jgi:hypothetical protein
LKGRAPCLRNRLLAWFAANPGEELTYEDIAARFHVTIGRAYAVVYKMRKAGEAWSGMVVRPTEKVRRRALEAVA